MPNSTEIHNRNNNSNNNSKFNSIYAVNVQFTGTTANPYSNLRGFRMSDGSFVSINSNGYASNISAVQTGWDKNLIKVINGISGIVGLTADAAKELGFTATIGSNGKIYIKWTTGNQYVKVFGVAKNAGYLALGVSTLTDIYLSNSNLQSWSETGLNLAVAYSALKIAAKLSGWYGIAFQLNYMAGKAYMKMLYDHPEYAPYPYHGFNH